MLKSQALQDACTQIKNAIKDLEESKVHLGSIRKVALSDDGQYVKRHIGKIDAIVMELRDYAETLDYELDDTDTTFIFENGGE